MRGFRIVCTLFESLSKRNGKELKAKKSLFQIGITHELKEPVFSQISMNISQIVSLGGLKSQQPAVKLSNTSDEDATNLQRYGRVILHDSDEVFIIEDKNESF